MSDFTVREPTSPAASRGRVKQDWIERRRDWVSGQKKAGVEGVFRATAAHLPLPPSLHDALRVPRAERAALAQVGPPGDGTCLEQALRAEAGGASALVIRPDESGAGHGYSDILALAQATPLPILCADIVVDPVQVVMARAHGAAAVWLSATVLPERELRALYRECVELGLECVISASSAQDMERAMSVRLGSADQSGARILAVEASVEEPTFARLSPMLPDYVVRLAMDARLDATRVARLEALGYEAFWAPDGEAPERRLSELAGTPLAADHGER
jgi:hypothetical protein